MASSTSAASGRIARRFSDLARCGGKALVTYLVGGDPDPGTSLRALQACARGGADILEIGMPFSDPMLEGPAIQCGHARALDAGMTMDGILQLVQSYRQGDADTPIVLMGYSNPVLSRGVDTFVRQAAEAGVDGLLLVDMPLEEIDEWMHLAGEQGLDMILLASPSTPADRMSQIARTTRGYLYYVSYKGVTGSAQPDLIEVGDRLKALQGDRDIPLAIGFGIRHASTACELAKIADAVVVGSALVEYCAEHPVPIEGIEQQVAELKMAISKSQKEV